METNENKRFKKFMADAEYEVNEKKKAVTCSIVSKGERIYGYSKCGPHDKFDVERGKEIASYRCEINQRKRDLRNTEQVISELQAIIANNEYQVYHRFLNRSEVSKHWDEFLKIAVDEKENQLENIRYCKSQIERLSNL